MGRWLVTSLLAFLAALTAARYVSSPSWIVWLWIATGLGSLSASLALSWVAWWLWPIRGKTIMALLWAVAATLVRRVLLSEILTRQDPPRIEIVPLALATATVAWGVLGLVWGTSALVDHAERPTPPREKAWAPAIASGLAVTLSLYSLTPLWALLGLRVDAWTLVGLVLLVSGAFALDGIHRRLVRRRGRRGRPV